MWIPLWYARLIYVSFFLNPIYRKASKHSVHHVFDFLSPNIVTIFIYFSERSISTNKRQRHFSETFEIQFRFCTDSIAALGILFRFPFPLHVRSVTHDLRCHFNFLENDCTIFNEPVIDPVHRKIITCSSPVPFVKRWKNTLNFNKINLNIKIK